MHGCRNVSHGYMTDTLWRMVSPAIRGMGRNNAISADSKEDDCEALWHRGSQRDGVVEAYGGCTLKYMEVEHLLWKMSFPQFRQHKLWEPFLWTLLDLEKDKCIWGQGAWRTLNWSLSGKAAQVSATQDTPSSDLPWQWKIRHFYGSRSV